MATRDLIVRILGDSKSLERTFAKSTATGKVFGREMEVVGRKTDKAFAGLSSLSSGRGLAGGLFAAAAIGGLKQLVDAASNSQQVLGQTRVALEDSGLSWEKYGRRVEAASASLAKLGFDDEEALKSISTFARATGDVSKAIDDTALAADVARGRYIDLAAATNIVLKASLGQAGALRRIGIDARNGASGLELLTLLSQKYGGAASSASTDAATANQRLKVELQNVQEQIGSGLLPSVALLSDQLSQSAENAGKLVKALQQVPVVGGVAGQSFGSLFSKALFVLSPPLRAAVIANKLFDLFGGDHAKAAAAASGKAFGDQFGLAALEAAGKAAPPVFGKPGTFSIPAAANIAKPLTSTQKNLFFDNATARAIDRVQDAPLKAQVVKLRGIEATIQKRIDATKDVTRKLNLEDQLVSVRRQRRSVEQQISDIIDQRLADAKAANVAAKAKELARVQATQFRALGLSATGGQVVPGVDNLRKQLASLSTHDLSSKVESQLARVGKVLSGAFGKVTKETREAIQELFTTIRSEFDKGAKDGRPLTKTTALSTERILAGLGLSRADERQLRARLSHFNSGGLALSGTGSGSGSVTINTVVDGKVVAKASAKYNNRTQKLNPTQRNGPNAGGWTGRG